MKTPHLLIPTFGLEGFRVAIYSPSFSPTFATARRVLSSVLAALLDRVMAETLVQSLWIGNRLSCMEQLSLRSFLAQGYRVQLYTYSPVANVPLGVEVRSGAEVLPANEIFVYSKGFGKGSPAAFSNLFRYKLLLERGGWWSDLDVICLRPLPESQEHVLGYERSTTGGQVVGTAIMRMAVPSPLAQRCFERASQIDKQKVQWGQIGPQLVNELVQELGLQSSVLAPDSFYPVNYFDVQQLVEGSLDISPESYCIHLWRAKWAEAHLNPDARYPECCLYEGLRRQFLPSGWERELAPRFSWAGVLRYLGRSE